MDTRKERRAALVDQRRANRRQAAIRYQRQQRNKRIAIGVIALIGALFVGYIGYGIYQDQQDETLLEGIASFDVNAGHVTEPVTYEQTPPVGGQHFNSWQNCGYYDAQVQNEYAVHSLEHGAVWITYRPDLPQEQIDVLRGKADQSYVLVSPYPDLPSPIVLSAWGKQLTLQDANAAEVDAFLRQYRQYPDAPEPGASCSGANSTTISS
jgi:hypothetical protein